MALWLCCCLSFIKPFVYRWTLPLHMLDESFCHLGGRVYFVAFNLFLMENPVSKECKTLIRRLYWVCTGCLWPFYGFPCKNGLILDHVYRFLW